MNVTINYIIATYPGITQSRNNHYSEKCLDAQLKILSEILIKKKNENIPCLIKRITLIITKEKQQHTSFKNYYDFDNWKKLFSELNIEIVFQDYIGENQHHSYDQWIQGIVKSWDLFSHHIIIEDDYCIEPTCIDFDTKLIEIYKTKFTDNIGYLSEKCGNNTSPPFQYHSWISNGVISSDTMKKLDTPLEIFYKYHEYPQIDFSYLFTDNNIPLADYTEYFKLPFWNHLTQEIVEFNNDILVTNFCFVPIEKIVFNV